MKQPTDLGMNRTGIDMSPIDAKELVDFVNRTTPTSTGDSTDLLNQRATYLKEAGPIGTVPVPGTVKGAAKSGLQKLTGKKPEVLLDKLGERLAFERSGTRLYEAFLGKCRIRSDEAAWLPMDQLQDFWRDEAQHFAMVAEVIKTLGADPTATTPAADLAGVTGMGLVQVITDPRTTVPQSLHAIHVAELADHDGWDLLVKLTREMGMTDVADRFQHALQEEERHLQTIRELMSKCVLTEAGVGS